MGTEITFGPNRSSYPMDSTDACRKACRDQGASPVYYQGPITSQDHVSIQQKSKPTDMVKVGDKPIPAGLLMSPAEVAGVGYARSIPIMADNAFDPQWANGDERIPLPQELAPHLYGLAGSNSGSAASNSINSNNSNGNSAALSGTNLNRAGAAGGFSTDSALFPATSPEAGSSNASPNNILGNLPLNLPGLPYGNLNNLMGTNSNNSPYNTTIRANGIPLGSGSPIINNVVNNYNFGPVNTTIHSNSNNGTWNGDSAGTVGGSGGTGSFPGLTGASNGGNGAGGGNGASGGDGLGGPNGVGGGNGANGQPNLQDLMKNLTPPEPPMPDKLPQPPMPPAGPQPPAPTKLPKSEMAQDEIMDLNKRLNNKDSMIRAMAALDFFNILESKPDLAELNSPYRDLTESFMFKILRDPDSLVRQPGLMAFEVGVFKYPNAKIMEILKELADGNGLEGYESGVVKSILSTATTRESMGSGSSIDRSNMPAGVVTPGMGDYMLKDAQGKKLDLKETGYPMPENPMAMDGGGGGGLMDIPTQPLAVSLPPHEAPPQQGPQQLPNSNSAPKKQNDKKADKANQKADSKAPEMLQGNLPAPGMPDPALMSQLGLPSNMDLSAVNQLGGSARGKAIGKAPQNKELAGTSGAGDGMAGLGIPNLPMPGAGGLPPGMDISQLMTPETLQQAFAMMPPELQNDPQMKALMTNPELMKQMLESSPDIKAQANAMMESELSKQLGSKAGALPNLSNLPQGAASGLPAGMDPKMMTAPMMDPKALSQMMTPEALQQAMSMMPPELQNNPMMKEMMANPKMMQDMIASMSPEELSLAQQMVNTSPLDLRLLPQDLSEAKPLPYSNVDQNSNLAYDGIAYPRLPMMAKPKAEASHGKRLDVTSNAGH